MSTIPAAQFLIGAGVVPHRLQIKDVQEPLSRLEGVSLSRVRLSKKGLGDSISPALAGALHAAFHRAVFASALVAC